MTGSLLGGLSVGFSVDMSGVNSGIASFKSSLSGVTTDVEQATAIFKGLEGVADGSRIVSNVDVAQAQLTLLESKVQEARANLQELQNSANAGEAVTGIPEAEANLTLLEAKAQEARSELQSLQNQEENTGGTAGGGLFTGIKSAASAFTGFTSQIGMAIFGFQQLYQGAISLAQGLLEPNASMEQTTVAFKQLLGSSSAATAELKDLQQFAASTPFEFPELATSTQKLLAFQIPLKDTKPLLTAIGDALSGLGNNTAASLDQVVNVFGQMNAAGKIQTQDLMQLTSVGINGFQILADQMHKPVSVIKDMVTSGVIPAKQGIEMLRAGMEKTFGGGMAAQAQTFNGLLSTFQDNIGAAMRAFTGPLFDAAKQGLTVLGNLVSSKSFQDFATSTGQGIANVFKSLSGPVQTVVADFQAAQPILQQIGAFLVTTFTPVWDQLVTTWKTQLIPAWQQFMTALQPAMPSLQLIAKALGGLVIIGLIGFLQSLAGALQVGIYLMGAMAQGASTLVQGYLQLVSLLQPVWQAIASGVQWLYNLLLGHSIIPDLVNGTIQWFTTLGTQVTQRVSGLITGIAKFFTGLPGQATRWMSDFGNSLVNGINAMIGRVMAAASRVASAISSVLHFSTPDQGPLVDVENWMPDLGNLLASGLNAQVSKIKAASVNVALAMPNSSLPTPSSSSSSSPLQGSSASDGGENHYHIYIGGKEVAHEVMNQAMRQMRVRTGLKV